MSSKPIRFLPLSFQKKKSYLWFEITFICVWGAAESCTPKYQWQTLRIRRSSFLTINKRTVVVRRFNPFGFHGRVPSEPSGINSLPLFFSLSLCLSRRTELWKIENGIKILHAITCISSRWYSFGGKWRKYVRPRNRSVRLIEKLSREQAKKCGYVIHWPKSRDTPPIYPGE